MGRNIIYYFLFILLVLGAFASMAQNDYGMVILGYTALAFAALFLYQALSGLAKQRMKGKQVLELISLAVVAGVLAMRVFYIRFPYIELVFGVASLALVVRYAGNALDQYRRLTTANPLIARASFFYYGSIIMYVFSMASAAFLPAWSEYFGMAGFGLLVLFLVVAITAKPFALNNDETTLWKEWTELKDQSLVLVIVFSLFTAYMGLTKIGVLPEMYTDEYPQVYYELVQQAESGEGKSLGMTESFKKSYEEFVSRHQESSESR